MGRGTDGVGTGFGSGFESGFESGFGSEFESGFGSRDQLKAHYSLFTIHYSGEGLGAFTVTHRAVARDFARHPRVKARKLGVLLLK